MIVTYHQEKKITSYLWNLLGPFLLTCGIIFNKHFFLPWDYRFDVHQNSKRLYLILNHLCICQKTGIWVVELSLIILGDLSFYFNLKLAIRRLQLLVKLNSNCSRLSQSTMRSSGECTSKLKKNPLISLSISNQIF